MKWGITMEGAGEEEEEEGGEEGGIKQREDTEDEVPEVGDTKLRRGRAGSLVAGGQAARDRVVAATAAATAAAWDGWMAGRSGLGLDSL
jgi:hypothetical protein